jgi:hypothetical protein
MWRIKRTAYGNQQIVVSTAAAAPTQGTAADNPFIMACRSRRFVMPL